MSETDKSWVEYLENRIAILDVHIKSLTDSKEQEHIDGVEAIDYYMQERNYFRGEVEKIKKANQECNPN